MIPEQQSTLKADIIAKSQSGQPLWDLMYPAQGNTDWPGIVLRQSVATRLW